jgi:hypothetical protein
VDLYISPIEQGKHGILISLGLTGLEIRGHPIVRDHHFLGKDDHVLTDGSPSDDLIFALISSLWGRTI